MASLFSRLMRPFSTAQALRVVPEGSGSAVLPAGAQKATIAAGCFWGVEHRYRHSFANKGLIDARVGYTGGDASDPNYRQVCSGKTGHAEALQIIFDPQKVSYRQLLEFFYKMHDPTTLNSQGPDMGTQYRSSIFFHDAEQESIAKDVTERANKEWYKGEIATEIMPAGQWWDAETYHQLYLDKNPSGYDCPTHFVRNFPELSKPESA
ncbi:uncharacterized protein K452DRAFT_234491 [Aplosporella prunicola CBS 121167]|uniref:peptide-methionine (S)-S-oxide reductase n=1 Tax=Aplosporella prunicola CBS 121167 TaxID=1176127 RepID=A0A6A6B4D7_9PEZI|nr:uncharacterized protein K452DRAFT_234491 [Aplosporella prunicola CBS 121167]KAF2138253.1 hypothetical protein K452DRAFT_234491 [Aplosporella prunicola CBS 121167]